RGGPRLGAGAAAGFAAFGFDDPNRLLRALVSFTQGHFRFYGNILAACALTAASPAAESFGAAEYIAEDIPQIDVAHVPAKTAETAARSGAGSARRAAYARMPEAIIGGTFLAVRQHFVGLVDGFELTFGVLIPGVFVRMKLYRLA